MKIKASSLLYWVGVGILLPLLSVSCGKGTSVDLSKDDALQDSIAVFEGSYIDANALDTLRSAMGMTSQSLPGSSLADNSSSSGLSNISCSGAGGSSSSLEVLPSSGGSAISPSSSVLIINPSSSSAVVIPPSSSTVILTPSSSSTVILTPSSSSTVILTPSSSSVVVITPSSSAMSSSVAPSSSAAVQSSSSGGGTGSCVAFVNGTGDYNQHCYNSGLTGMVASTCYTMNPDRGTPPQWINETATDTYWWITTPCL